MEKSYESEILIYTKELPDSIKHTVAGYILKKNHSLQITKKEMDSVERCKYPDAKTKFSITGNCAHLNNDFRKIISLLKQHTIDVKII